MMRVVVGDASGDTVLGDSRSVLCRDRRMPGARDGLRC